MRWLITGGCGFIGAALVRRLSLDDAHHIRVIDNLTVGSRADLLSVDPRAREQSLDDLDWSAPSALVVADVENARAMLDAASGAEVIVHLAANTGVAPSVEDPFADARTNVLGTLNVLEAARHGRINRVVFASSGAPLGEQVPPLHEEMAPRPASPYGASKLAGEGYCSAYYHCFGVETVALRFGNVYGPGSEKKESVVAKFIKTALAGERLEIYGDGEQTRDFIFLDDLLRAIELAATVDGIGGEVLQIATNRETTVGELVEQLLATLARAGIDSPEVVHAARRQGDVMRNFSDTSKAHEHLGWTCAVDIAEGLDRTVAHFLAVRSVAAG